MVVGAFGRWTGLSVRAWVGGWVGVVSHVGEGLLRASFWEVTLFFLWYTAICFLRCTSLLWRASSTNRRICLLMYALLLYCCNASWVSGLVGGWMAWSVGGCMVSCVGECFRACERWPRHSFLVQQQFAFLL